MEASEIASIPDAEFDRELMRREQFKREARQQAVNERRRLAREAQEAKDRAFAAGIGITWEQFQAAEDYLSDKFHAAQ